MDPKIGKIYGNRVRIRVCGICRDDCGSLLMVNHKMLTNGNFWAPPGGGVEFGNSAEETLVKEFQEETGLKAKIGPLLFICEFIKDPLHAIELFFEVTKEGGQLITGTDPEMGINDQIIENVRFLTFDEITRIPPEEKHGIFNRIMALDDLRKIPAYVKLTN